MKKVFKKLLILLTIIIFFGGLVFTNVSAKDKGKDTQVERVIGELTNKDKSKSYWPRPYQRSLLFPIPLINTDSLADKNTRSKGGVSNG